ncbi:MAG: DUF1700 domain-containing protein [Porcipelethomonas sp.]
MNKQEFLDMLRDSLSGLPQEDIERSIDYYSEMIEDRIEDGAVEEEAVDAVGSPEKIASQILMEIPLPRLVRAKVAPKQKLKMWEKVLIFSTSPVWVPVLLAAAVIVLSGYILIWSAVVILYSVLFSFAAGAAGSIFTFVTYMFTGRIEQGILFLGAGLIFAGLSVFMLFGFNKITRGIVILSREILLGIKSCFIRKGEA